MRFLLPDKNIAPYRRFYVERKIDIELYIGNIQVGPFTLKIFNKRDDTVHFTNMTNEFTLMDETEKYVISPPLLRPNVTTTYTEFRDLLIYLNLPVFRSKLHKYMLFFPNYVQHKILLDIQGPVVNNHTLLYPKSIQWRWFNLPDVDAQEEIKLYCSNFDEDIRDPDYGIESVNYVWYSVKLINTFGEEHFKNYIFLKTKDIRDVEYFSNSSVLFSMNADTQEITYYIYNDIIHDHALIRLNKQHNINAVYLPEGQEPTIDYYNEELSRLQTQLMEEEKKAVIHKGFEEWLVKRKQGEPKKPEINKFEGKWMKKKRMEEQAKNRFQGGWMKVKYDYYELKQYKTN